MASFKCPKCENLISVLKIEPTKSRHNSSTFKSVAYIFPLCNTIISASIDPFALIEEIKSALKR